MGNMRFKWCTKLIKTMLTILFFISVSVLCFVLSSEFYYNKNTADAHSKIETTYVATPERYLYVLDDEVDRAETAETVNNILLKIPEHIAEEVKNNWIILISTEPPQGTHPNAVVGLTYDTLKVIWVTPNFTENTLVHEIGHAVSSIQHLDISKDFRDLYDLFTEQYFALFESKYHIHEISSSVEFFALLFEQYIYNPSYLKENFAEGYDYISEKVINSELCSEGFVPNALKKNYNILSYEFSKICDSVSVLYDLSKIEGDVANNPLIQNSDYSTYISFSGLTEDDMVVRDKIFDVIYNPEKYLASSTEPTSTVVIEYAGRIDFSTCQKISSLADFYFGVEHADVFDIYDSDKGSKIHIRLDDVIRLKQERETYLAKIDEVLESLHEGSETQKLLQISKYIADNSDYTPAKKTSVDDFWSNKEADSITYAMVFRLFCERIGIPCDIMFGALSDGSVHAWNRIQLSDGSYRYYDLTDFESGKLDIQQYDKCPTFTINDYLLN